MPFCNKTLSFFYPLSFCKFIFLLSLFSFFLSFWFIYLSFFVSLPCSFFPPIFLTSPIWKKDDLRAWQWAKIRSGLPTNALVNTYSNFYKQRKLINFSLNNVQLLWKKFIIKSFSLWVLLKEQFLKSFVFGAHLPHFYIAHLKHYSTHNNIIKKSTDSKSAVKKQFFTRDYIFVT